MLTAGEIRGSFQTFFASKGHRIVPSAPLVIQGDPTLMFTNAGMNRFKDIILGNAPVQYPRVADAQKCLRVSGKHNDLEEVGRDTYHHTMFEMLGNWSFGDYFKQEAIDWAWEYLTEALHLPAERFYATVFAGSDGDGLKRDSEAAKYWQQHLPPTRILDGSKKDNFWEMGDVGPCGPCSEIHIDLRTDNERKATDGAQLVNKNHPLVIELWNLVFMEYNRKADGALAPLPAKVIDTGMGFERLCMAVQQKTSNYDTDVFMPLIRAVANLSGFSYGDDAQRDIAMRVAADHIRAIAFAIADGQLPSNIKAGYVIRRILRRAVRYAYTFLDRREAFMFRLLPALTDSMGDAYPELLQQQPLLEKVIKEEEEAFLRTLETGIRLLAQKTHEASAPANKRLSGADAFTLYDTYGFPIDLTELMANENGWSVDLNEFNRLLAEQKKRARNDAAVTTGDWITLCDGDSSFVGYDNTQSEARILRYRQVRHKNNNLFHIVLDRTPFYAEKGGQVGDTGWLISGNDTIAVIDTKNDNNLTIHLTDRLPSNPADPLIAKIDHKRRQQCECNHTATHLLHQTLREILGKHVEQRGSLVSPDALRFDFAHFRKLSPDELRRIEQSVNEKIRADFHLQEQRNIPLDKAKQLGAIALFGEKYGDNVRTIRFGDSIELCAGTHIASTGHIGSLRILAESSVAAGIRRIEAVTAYHADNAFFQLQDTLQQLRELTNNPQNPAQAVRKILRDNADLKKQLQTLTQQQATQLKQQLLNNPTTHNGITILQYLGDQPLEILKTIAFQLRTERTDPFIFIAATHNNHKASILLLLSKHLTDQGLNADSLIKQIAPIIQGNGGGQPHFATATGPRTDRLPAAIQSLLRTLLPSP